MSNNISLKLLKAFLMLAEQKHFTRAAERCHLSQSAFSTAIQRLEEEVGARLFDRNTRKVVLTAEGELLVEAARHLVAEIEWTFSDLKDYVSRKKGRVGIAALPSIAAEWLPPVIARYCSAYPGISVEIYDVMSDRCVDLVRQGRADIALAAPALPMDEFLSEPFYSDRFYLICRRDHPLAARTSVSLAELAGCDFVRLARTTSVSQYVELAVGASSLRSARFDVEQLATVAGLIRNGLGISLLPELTLSQFRHPDLVSIPVDDASLLRTIYLIRRKDRSLSIAAQALMEFIHEANEQLTTSGEA